MLLLFFRLFFLVGFVFLLGVGVWAIVTVTRLRREQTIAITTLRLMAAKLGLELQDTPPELKFGRRQGDLPT